MPIIEIPEKGGYQIDKWNAVALPVSGDGVCGSGLTFDFLSQHEGGIEFARQIKQYYRTEKLNGGCRYFAYDINRRAILLEWRTKWKGEPSLERLQLSLTAFRQTYRRNVIDNVIFPYWDYRSHDITYEQFLDVIGNTLDETGMLIGVVKPQ